MYSINVPVPGRVKRLAADLYPHLVAFDRVRERHTLVVKRFERGGRTGDRHHALAVLREELRPALTGAPAFEARVSGIGCFERPVRGPGPVVYLAVESPGLERLHRRLVGEFGTVLDLEGEAYVPHVTLARDGPIGTARQLCEMGIEPIEWAVGELVVRDATYREPVGRVSLPA